MRNYELLLIVRAALDDAGVNGVVEAVTELIESHQGEVLATKPWGRRKLAYPIKKQGEGVYFLVRAAISPAALQEIEFSLKLNENLLRYLLVVEMAATKKRGAEPEQASEEVLVDEAPALEETTSVEAVADADNAPAEASDEAEPTVVEDPATTASAD